MELINQENFKYAGTNQSLKFLPKTEEVCLHFKRVLKKVCVFFFPV